MDDRSSIRRFECSQCGAPLASMLCAYCGSHFYASGEGDKLRLDTAAYVRMRRDFGIGGGPLYQVVSPASFWS